MTKVKITSPEMPLRNLDYVLPVVMMADLIAAGDQLGWNDLT